MIEFTVTVLIGQRYQNIPLPENIKIIIQECLFEMYSKLETQGSIVQRELKFKGY